MDEREKEPRREVLRGGNNASYRNSSATIHNHATHETKSYRNVRRLSFLSFRDVRCFMGFFSEVLRLSVEIFSIRRFIRESFSSEFIIVLARRSITTFDIASLGPTIE